MIILYNIYNMHLCTICYQSFNQKGHLKEHLNKKNKCEKINWENVIPMLKNEPGFVKALSNNDFLKQKNVKTNNPIKVADFFAGIGTSSYIFDQNKNFEIVYANDMEQNSKKIYDYNLNHKMDCRNLNDIKPTEIPNFDLFIGGFPCQPFSIAGERLGFNDVRSNVFWKILEILDYHKPKYLILENVKNLTTHDNGNTFKTIIDNLEKREYYIKYKILNTKLITNIPQNRERIFIMGFLNKEEYDKFEFPSQIENTTQLKDMFDKKVDTKYYYTDRLKVWNLIQEKVVKHINTNTLYQYRRTKVRENKTNVCPTLTANMGSGGHNVPLLKDDFGIRKITPRECFRLQGFHDNYKFPPKTITFCTL